MRPLAIRAFAKVNLDLRVLSRRPDGYHEIRTIFQTLALHDTLSFGPARGGGFELRAVGEPVPAGSQNIVWRAARAVWEAMGRRGEPQGISIRLVKRIPVQAGLGGGSSDAAAALVAFDRLWRAGLSEAALFELAAGLGSDVPFFLLGGAAMGTGRGEVLVPLPDLPSRHVVLARPATGVSTAEAYAWLDADTGRAALAEQRLIVSWPPGAVGVANDFEPMVSRRLPEVQSLRQALIDQGAEVAMMSGSGSAVFGLFVRDRAAKQAATRLRENGVPVWQTEFRPRGRTPRPR
jgi:4-diphosphocytidyl-2-C-methyl-D-erythritol kinase